MRNYTIQAHDNDGGMVSLSTVVSSSQPINGPGDGNTAPDWEITGPLTLNLRAERMGEGSGRVYTITVESRDAFGNISTGTVQILVAHNR
jgi:hypothetical protein